MAAPWVLFDAYGFALGDGAGPQLATADLRCALIFGAAIPDKATVDFWDDLIAREVSGGTQYVAGGKALTTKTWTLAAGVSKFDADDISWAQDPVGPTNARWAILRVHNAVAAASRLLAHLDLEADRSLVTGPLTIEIDALGILAIVTA